MHHGENHQDFLKLGDCFQVILLNELEGFFPKSSQFDLPPTIMHKRTKVKIFSHSVAIFNKSVNNVARLLKGDDVIMVYFVVGKYLSFFHCHRYSSERIPLIITRFPRI